MQIQRYNEIDLIRQTLAGDTSAFDRLVKTHRATVYVLVLSYTKNRADAEDLTQRIFIRAYERLATLRDWIVFYPGFNGLHITPARIGFVVRAIQ